MPTGKTAAETATAVSKKAQVIKTLIRFAIWCTFVSALSCIPGPVSQGRGEPPCILRVLTDVSRVLSV